MFFYKLLSISYFLENLRNEFLNKKKLFNCLFSKSQEIMMKSFPFSEHL